MPEHPHLSAERAAAEFAEFAPFGYLSMASDGSVLVTNPTLLDWLGRADQDPDAVIGRPFTDLLKPGARVVWLTQHAPRLYAEGRLDGLAIDLVRADGTVLQILLTAMLVSADEDSDVRMTMVDASGRRAYEQNLLLARVAAERAEWRMTALQRVTEVCAIAMSEEVLLADVTRAITVSLEAERSRIWMPVGDDPLTAPVLAADTDPDQEEELPAAVRAVWEQGVPLLPEAPGAGNRSDAAVRFGHLDAPLGVLEVQLPATWRGSATDAEVLKVMGTVLGQALVRVRLHGRLVLLAQFDGLTGLPNRNLLVDRLEQAIDRAERSLGSVAVLYADLNGFKAVNDGHGHAVGDLVLRVCAERMAEVLRSGDMVARIGGDEFVILCEGADEVMALEIAERLREVLTRDLSPDVPVLGPDFRVGVSVGIAIGNPPFAPDAAASLVAASDAAMYDVKRAVDDL